MDKIWDTQKPWHWRPLPPGSSMSSVSYPSRRLSRRHFHLQSCNLPSSGHTMGARAVALLDIFLDCLGIGIGLFFLSYLTNAHPNMNEAEKETLLEMGFLGVSAVPSKLGITILLLYLIYMTTELIFAIVLLVGLSQRSITLCDLWITFAMVNFFIKGVQLVYFLSLDKENLMGVISFFAEPLVRVAMFYVIYTHTEKLKRTQSSTQWGRCRKLSPVNMTIRPGFDRNLNKVSLETLDADVETGDDYNSDDIRKI